MSYCSVSLVLCLAFMPAGELKKDLNFKLIEIGI
jgi:hypothetical protein